MRLRLVYPPLHHHQCVCPVSSSLQAWSPKSSLKPSLLCSIFLVVGGLYKSYFKQPVHTQQCTSHWTILARPPSKHEASVVGHRPVTRLLQKAQNAWGQRDKGVGVWSEHSVYFSLHFSCKKEFVRDLSFRIPFGDHPLKLERYRED